MKQQFSLRTFICMAIISTSLLCVSCKYIDDNFLPKQKVAVDSIKKSEYLSKRDDLNQVDNLENTDSLTAIFDENGNIVESVTDAAAPLNNNSEAGTTNIVPISENKNEAVNKVVTPKNAISKNNGTKIATTIKNGTDSSKNNKSVKSKNSVIKSSNTNNTSETDAERDYRLQKSNHSIPDL